MADEKISAMTAAGALTGPELLAGVQSGANVKITAAQVLTYIEAALEGGTTLSEIIDAAAGDAQGSVLVRGASVWAAGGAPAPTGTYNDVTVSRALGSTYTNARNVPIYVTAACTVTSGTIRFICNGVFIAYATGAGAQSVGGWANPGDTYQIDATSVAALGSWFERY